ncbi:sugar phosphate isomerase/epimerase family protein [Nonomuraea sp. NPDC050790]|uniref:sugar phosphate isomerase/epimerase family protein n=1 Tax=Nonomuraea sp. NPDC050790 TaxID=3364371 RepID=UPI00378E2D28
MINPLNVQLYSVRDPLSADRDATLRRISGIGYRAVEPFDPTNDPQGMRATCDDLGLAIPSTHAYALLGEETGPVFEAIVTLGAELAIIPGGIPHEEFTTRDGLLRTSERLLALAEQGREYGVRIGYHNHWWEIEPVIDGHHALELLAPEIFLEVDTYWAYVGGADVPALLRRLGDRVLALHVKDGPGVKDEPHTAVGSGVLPVPEILSARPGALRIVELDSCDGDIFDALAGSHAYLSALEVR